MNIDNDLFIQWERLPKDIQELLESFGEVVGYTNCDIFILALNKVGYTCDYGLEGAPYDLRLLTNEEKEEMSLLTI